MAFSIQKHPHSDTLVAIRFKDKSINEGIRDVVSDNFGNLWILTKKNLYISNGGTIKIVDFVSDEDHNMLHSINITHYQNYWLTSNKNLVKLNESGFQHYLENILDFSTIFTSSIIDPLGRIWAGTLGQGILVYEPLSGKNKFITSKQGLINDNILSMVIADNIIWVATLGGTSAILLDEFAEILNIKSFNKENGLSSNFIYTVFADSKGRIWFGTDGNGIIKLENNIFYTYDEMHGINDKIIYSIIEDRTGSIWFSTSSGLIYRFEGSDFVEYTPSHGYEGNNIFSMATEGNFLFILTEQGLNVYNYLTNNFVCFNEELGINRISSDLNSVCKGNQLICFATHNRVIQIDLDLINRISLQPASSIDRITVNLEPVNTAEYQQFTFNENRFIFDYSGSWPQAPEKLQYLVKLVGYDHNWKSTFDRSAIYPNLPPGDYTFYVKAYLNNPNQENVSSSYYFTISQPFYFTWWFIMSVSLCALLAIFWFIKLREQNLKKREAQKMEQLEFEFQTLKNQINPHFLFNSFSTLISIIEDNQEDAVDYAEALSAFFRNILEVKDELLIPLDEELKMMKNYSLIHQKRLGNIFKMKINLDEEVMLTKIPPLTLQLLTENALKHNVIAKGKPLTVTIKNTNKWIIVENNVRLKKKIEKSTGIGLRNIQERYKLISKTEIIIESNSEKFRILLPIIK